MDPVRGAGRRGDASVPAGVAQAGAINQREHTVLVEDISGSMVIEYVPGVTKLEAAKQAGITMVVNKARIDAYDQMGLVTFSSEANILMPISSLHSHKPALIKALQSLTIAGGTDINEGLVKARDLFDWRPHDVVRRIVLLTDGVGGDPERTAEELKARNVVIDVIGIGENPSDVDEDLLRRVASVVAGATLYRFIKDHKTLITTYTQLANKTLTTG